MRTLSRSSRNVVLGLFAWVMIFCATGSDRAYAQYQLQPGDILELSALGLPSLSRRITIDPDGLASFPLIGPIEASGRNLAEARKIVQDQFSQKLVRFVGATGTETTTYLLAEDIDLTIAEFTPIYVSGDVARPGAQPFRPGLTVQQAIAVAGGFGTERDEFDVIDAQSDMNSLHASLALETARLKETEARLDDEDGLLSEHEDPFLATLLELSANRLKTDVEQYNRERLYLQATLSKADARVSVLRDQLGDEQEGARLDLEESTKLQDLFGRGLVTADRQTAARRISLLSSTRALQTSVHADQAARDRDQTQNQLLNLESRRKMDLLASKQDALIRIADFRAKLSAAENKLRLGKTTSNDSDIAIEIRRRIAKTISKIDVEEDESLHPGDLVTVDIRRKNDVLIDVTENSHRP